MSIRRVMLVALLAVAITPPVQAVAAPPAADPASFVNPFIGTGSGGPVVGEVDTFPGATLPFGMVQWSPDTPRRPAGGGYWFDDHDITGFSLTHLSGVGCPTGGDLPFLPWTGPVPADPSGATLPFTHADESASPGAYSVVAGGIRTELTATARTGLARLTYPRSDQARLLVKVAGSQNGSAGATFAAVGDREITGSVTSGRFCNQPNAYTVYFAARFDRPFTASGTWGSSAARASVAARASGPALGAGPASRRAPLAVAAPVAGGDVSFYTPIDPGGPGQVAGCYVGVSRARGDPPARGSTHRHRAQP